MNELKPCPFCGGEAKSFEHGDVGFVVQCRRCGIWNAGYSPAWSHITEDEFHGFIDEADAIEAWNERDERTCKREKHGTKMDNPPSCDLYAMECTLEVSRHEVLGGAEKTTSCKWSGYATLEVVNTMLRMMREAMRE